MPVSHPSRPARRSRCVASLTAAAVVAGSAATAVAADRDEAPSAPDVRTAAASSVRSAPEPRLDDIARIKAFRAQAAAQAAADEPADDVEAASTDDEVAPAPAGAARSVWDDLADCESGDWDGRGLPIAGTATWSYGAGYFEGGLQFDPRTWDGFRDTDMPGHAGRASRQQQIVVAERVLAAQGWGAWPVCSRKLGLR